MNLSGQVVADYMHFFKIPIEDLLIIHDDLDLYLGNYKLKQKGSSGGHNGLKDIENHLKSDKYKRLKIGISNNKTIDTKDYVLGKFTRSECEQLDILAATVDHIIDDFLVMRFDDLMSKYNSKNEQ